LVALEHLSSASISADMTVAQEHIQHHLVAQ